jgi:DNA replication and repair protein RecF
LLLSLSTLSFRSLADSTWRPPPGATLLLGPNGAGKTSLLEAVYLLSTTRSFRTAQLAHCARHGAAEFALAGETDSGQRTRLDLAWSVAGLSRAVNGRAAELASHLAAQPVLSWTTGDRDLLTGPPAPRRRFLDRGLVGERPAALDILARYRRALEQKRLLLVRREDGVETWNELLALHGAELIRWRADYVGRLARVFAERAAALDPRFSEVELVYRPSPAEGVAGAAELLRRLASAHPAEQRRRLPLVGPHRDDLLMRWRGQEVRAGASAGERKALGLLLLAAQGALLETAGRPPLYLLDDADAELDRQALERTFRAFAAAPQVFASSNRPEVWAGVEISSRTELREGRILSPPSGAGV